MTAQLAQWQKELVQVSQRKAELEALIYVGSLDRKPPEPEMHTTTSAARYCGVSRQTIYNAIQQGKLKPDGENARGKWFAVETLDKYVREHV